MEKAETDGNGIQINYLHVPENNPEIDRDQDTEILDTILEETDNSTSELPGSGDDEHGDIRYDTLENVPEGDNPMDDTAGNKLDVLGNSIDSIRQGMEHVDSLQTWY